MSHPTPSNDSHKLSAIVMGDDSVFCGNQQYSSTMKIHYKNHKLDDHTLSNPSISAAGRPLGITGSSSEIHVVFGDRQKPQPERLKSVTAQEYVALAPTGDYVPKKLRSSPGVGSSSSFEGPRDKWEGSKELIMSAAHVGLQTRANLPCDDKKFCSFVTTSQQAYSPDEALLTSTGPNSSFFYSNNSSVGSISKSKKTSKQYQNDHNAKLEKSVQKPKIGTSIPQGDRDKQRSYDSIASTSFVTHPKDLYYNLDRRTHEAQPIISTKALLGTGSAPSVFTTTSQSTYKLIPLETAYVPAILGKDHGKSSIAFGEHYQRDVGPR